MKNRRKEIEKVLTAYSKVPNCIRSKKKRHLKKRASTMRALRERLILAHAIHQGIHPF
jgi:hypothetical protein